MKYIVSMVIELPEGEDINVLACTSLLINSLVQDEQLHVIALTVEQE